MKQNNQSSIFPLFNPVVNDASLFEANASKPGILIPFTSWADVKAQFFAPFLVILNAIEECIRTPIEVVLSLWNMSISCIQDDQEQAKKEFIQGFLAICYLLHLIPFSVICDFAITVICCITRTMATMVQPFLPNHQSVATKTH